MAADAELIQNVAVNIIISAAVDAATVAPVLTWTTAIVSELGLRLALNDTQQVFMRSHIQTVRYL